MDETRYRAVLKMHAEVMQHLSVAEMALTLLLSGKEIPDDLREGVVKALSDMTLAAMNTADAIETTLGEDE